MVEADQNYHGVLPIRVECWMDEFGNGLRPEGFEHLITTLRSRNIAVMLFLQSISQLQTMYKGDGWKVFMDSCLSLIHISNTSDTTGHQEDSNNTSDAGDAPLSESALNEMEKNAEQNQ